MSPTESDIMHTGGMPQDDPVRHLTSGNYKARGLRNLGNTGWMNTGVQCLRGVKELTLYFLEGRYKAEINSKNPLGYEGKMAEAYASLLTALYDEKTEFAFGPRAFKIIVERYSGFGVGHAQQDAQQFLGFLTDAIQEDLSRITKRPYLEMPKLEDELTNDAAAVVKFSERCKELRERESDSIIKDLFEGVYKSTLTCIKCNKILMQFRPFIYFTVKIPLEDTWRLDEDLNAKLQDGPEMTLEDCIEFSVKKDITAKEDEWYCPRCKNYVPALHRYEIWTAPDILMIHLSRFERSYGGIILTMVEFPLEGFDLSNLVGLDEGKSLVYDAFAVVNHDGGADGGGHYSAFVQNFEDKKWCEYDDLRVEECDASAVVTSGAYVLFYRRRRLDTPA